MFILNQLPFLRLPLQLPQDPEFPFRFDILFRCSRAVGFFLVPETVDAAESLLDGGVLFVEGDVVAGEFEGEEAERGGGGLLGFFGDEGGDVV